MGEGTESGAIYSSDEPLSAKSISCSRDGNRAANVTGNDTDRDIISRSKRTAESGADGSDRVPSVQTASTVVDKATRLVGGAGLFRSSPLEQMHRDSRTGILHQPFAGYDGRGWLGKLAFGIPPDVMPRWE